MSRSILFLTKSGCRRWVLAGVAAICLALMLLLSLDAAAQAIAATSRGEIISRAFSALETPYSQTAYHCKSYLPDELLDEGSGNCADSPYTDCSGLLQKCWQVPTQLYPGEVPSTQYNASMFKACQTGDWYAIGQSSLVKGDGLASTSHCMVYVKTISGTWWIIEAVGPVVYRPWPYWYSASSYQAIRRSNIEGTYATEVLLDNNTARQRGGTVDYCGSGVFQDWSKSTSISGYAGIDYQHQSGTGTGTEATARYTPWLPQSGYYNVYMWTPVYSTYSDNVKVTVQDTYGTSVYYIDETIYPGAWKGLGQHYFYDSYNPSSGSVTISTYGSSGSEHVIADKIWFRLVQ
jgi:hypothetical protein